MSRRFIAPAAAIYVVVSNGCADPIEASQDTWVDGEIPATSDSGDDDSGGSSEEDQEDEELYALWLVEGVVVPGTSFTGGGELVVLDDADEERCVLVWEVVDAKPVTECAECQFAFELALGPVEIDYELERGACEGWLALAVEGQREPLGYADGGVLRFDGAAWVLVGEGAFAEATGEFSGEYEPPFEE